MARQITLKDHFFESRLVMNRAILLLVAGGILLAVLLARLLYLQVFAHEHFTTLSEDNRVKLQAIAPNRGLIYDRNGILLAENLPSYRLEITPEQIGDMDATLAALEENIEIRDSDRSRGQPPPLSRGRHRRRSGAALPAKFACRARTGLRGTH